MAAELPHADTLRAYLNLLRNNGTKRSIVSQSEHLARQLLAKLSNHAINHVSYRAAVDALLDSLPESYHSSTVTVAREFYPFLMSDIKSVANLMTSGNYRGTPDSSGFLLSSDIRNIDDLIRTADKSTLTEQESAIHKQYITCLTALGAADDIIDTRAKISKTLLYLSRNLTINGKNYRSILNQILPILSLEETRLYVLRVAREFFYFLTEDPDAAAMVKLQY